MDAANTADDSGARTALRVGRPLLTAGVITGLVAAFVAGAVVGGHEDGSAPGVGLGGGTSKPPEHVAFGADLPAAQDCDDLLDTYIERALPQVTAWGWDRPFHASPFVDRTTMAAAEGSSARDPVAKVQRRTNSETGTNVQEAHVDEPDVVKTDGSLLVRMRDDELITYDVTGERVERLASLDLAGIEDAEILLAGDTVIAVGTDEAADRGRGTRVVQVSVVDPSAPEVVTAVTHDAAALSVRQHDEVVRLVTSSGLPELDFVQPGSNARGQAAARRTNREVVRETTIEDWLPTITTQDSTEQLLDCGDVAIPDDDLALDTVSVIGFAADEPATVSALGLAGATDIAYESRDHLYLAASPSWGRFWGMCRCVGDPGPSVTDGTSHVFDFRLDGVHATHVASGEVEGTIADRWSMDEYDDVLRVAVGSSSETGDFNAVVTFRREGADLVELGRLDRIGAREDIMSVRWMDGLAIVVTFRRIDPLYAIDLTDDADPTLLSELKIPGFSDYLHPLGSKRMIGVGQGPDGDRGWGAQMGLFDVTDLTDVRRIDVHSYAPGTQARPGDDPRAFTWLPEHRTVLTVIDGHRGGSRVGWVSVQKLVAGEFRNRMVQVEYGRDVDQVRTVPLPDGRVVLVTGEDAEFFSLTAA